MELSLSFLMLAADAADVPGGGLSPLAWAIIVALAGTLAAVAPALWLRGNKMQDRAEQIRGQMYEDLKECNRKRNESEEEILDLMKLLRLMMDRPRPPKGGK